LKARTGRLPLGVLIASLYDGLDPSAVPRRREEGNVFKVIVLGLDGSDESDRAIPVAQELAQKDGGRIEVVHVRELMVGRAGGYPVHPDEADIETKVRTQVDELNKAGTKATLRVITAASHGPAHEIAEVADELHADLIAVGTRGRGPVAGLLLGSVTHRLLHIATCPVMAVPPAHANGAGKERA
jgi:nucleotide-binding universal stress UspA family protein